MFRDVVSMITMIIRCSVLLAASGNQVQREVINAMMDTAIIIIMDALLNAVRKCFNATEEQMNLLLVEFISELPESWKARFQLPASA